MNKERRNFIVFIVTTIVFVTIIVGVGLYAQTRENIYQESIYLDRRQHIFCELLKPGMDENTVLMTIRQFGTFEQDKSSFGERHFDIYIQYNNSQIIGPQLVFLEFRDGEYSMAWLQQNSEREAICKPQ
jgi:hypothetical protein